MKHARTTGYLAFAAGIAGTIFMFGVFILANTNALTGEPPPESWHHPIFASLTLLVLPPFVLIALFFLSLRRVIIRDGEALAWSLVGLLVSTEFTIRMAMWLGTAYLIFHSDQPENTEFVTDVISLTFDVGLILQLSIILIMGWQMPASFPARMKQGTLLLVGAGSVFYLLSGIAIFSLLANLAGVLWMMVIGSYLLIQAAAREPVAKT